MRRIVSFILLLELLSFALSALGEAPASAAKEIVISFTGDCTLGCDPRERGEKSGFEAYIEQYGYGYPFEKVKQIFEQDDLTVINLEGTLYDYDANMKPDVNYHFRGPTDYVNILSASSIEACSIGNNHILDYGTPGLRSTIEALEAAGKICACGRVAIMAAKESVNRAYEGTLSDGVMFERRLFHSLFATEAQKEGMDAFMNKRKAAFKNQ